MDDPPRIRNHSNNFSDRYNSGSELQADLSCRDINSTDYWLNLSPLSLLHLTHLPPCLPESNHRHCRNLHLCDLERHNYDPSNLSMCLPESKHHHCHNLHLYDLKRHNHDPSVLPLWLPESKHCSGSVSGSG